MKVNGNKTIAHNKIKAKLGITDKTNQSVFYLEGGGFITPNKEYDNYNELMTTVESFCKRSIKSKLRANTALTTDFIMNFEVCSERMMPGKQTYLSFQYHFKQKPGQNKSVIDIKSENEAFFVELLDDITNGLLTNDIDITKSKTEIC